MARAWKIDGQTLKNPSKFSWKWDDNAKYKQSLAGKVFKTNSTPKIELDCDWAIMLDTDTEAQTTVSILSALRSNTYISLTYPDPSSATDLTKTFMVTGIKAEMVSLKDDVAFWECSASFSEQ